ncbi:hypothetical protein V1477_014922 [Vespula maculifrons]|uniref:Uncharacterized protein n=1 Tax=Vespula maculifrons TaxID=7453 RepID=A0ABD2BIT4_VESMC
MKNKEKGLLAIGVDGVKADSSHRFERRSAASRDLSFDSHINLSQTYLIFTFYFMNVIKP